MTANVPFDELNHLHGIMQTFSNGKLVKESQYKQNKIYGCSVCYGAHGKPMSAMIILEDGEIARFI
ncbi:MAG: hypothetical protein P8J32_01975 [bacterium]|nr:hypothetical protein [bacterium]